MRPGALPVDAGRGGTVDSAALEEALRAGALRAALDVTDPEPLPEGHRLLTAPGCMITPHVAGRTAAFPANAYRFARAQLERHLRGEPLANVVRSPMGEAAAAA
jgi:phosphoglycerate dehydrogenase-like enzyme